MRTVSYRNRCHLLGFNSASALFPQQKCSTKSTRTKPKKHASSQPEVIVVYTAFEERLHSWRRFQRVSNKVERRHIELEQGSRGWIIDLPGDWVRFAKAGCKRLLTAERHY